MQSTQAAGDGTNVLKNLAARLLAPRGSNIEPASPSMSKATATAPRTMPTSPRPAGEPPQSPLSLPPSATPTTKPNSPPKAVKENIAPTAQSPKSDITIKPTTSHIAPTVLAPEGPSLRGTPEQLAVSSSPTFSSPQTSLILSRAANSFLAQATKGRHGRDRLFSNGDRSAGSTSPRTPVVRTGAPGGYPFTGLNARSNLFTATSQASSQPSSSVTFSPSPAVPRPTPTIPAQAALVPAQVPDQVKGWSDIPSASTILKSESTPLQRPPVPPPTPATPSVVGPKKNAGVDDITKGVEKVGLNTTDGMTATTSKAKAAVSSAAERHAADVKNILNDRAKDRTPPHLKARNASDAITAAEKTTTVAEERETTRNDVMAKTFVPATTIENAATTAPVVDTTPVEKERNPVPAGTEASAVSAVSPSGQAVSSTVGGYDGILLEEVKGMVIDIQGRMKSFEAEQLIMSKQLEKVIQAEERRKFLGTDSAKVPFMINVSLPGGVVENVQAQAMLKVNDLIRRVRTNANLAAHETKNPRILVNGKQVGHTMTLGEAGVGKDGSAEVAFSYDGAEK